MRIANTEVPLAHGTAEVLSNVVYWIAAVAVAVAAGVAYGHAAVGPWTVALGAQLAVGLIVQATGSMAFHATPPSERWGHVMDGVGIQWAMSALVALGMRAALPVPAWLLAPGVLVAWAAWWTQADHVSRVLWIGIQIGVSILLLGLSVSWPLAGAVVLVVAGAVTVQRLSRVHSLAHAWGWHVPTGLTQGAAGALFLLLG